MNKTKLTHIDENGASRMVDVSGKEITERIAVAHAKGYHEAWNIQIDYGQKGN